ncbi:unnamed protein product [Mytilus coruscus]|uniref:HECT domain-containing protein n=1 Tax=Mytilus coruscus TaxID=42192 RepID=A0A6J8B0R6_MYTCO|nr:unnamed protein product [Mytilus coruscus]
MVYLMAADDFSCDDFELLAEQFVNVKQVCNARGEIKMKNNPIRQNFEAFARNLQNVSNQEEGYNLPALVKPLGSADIFPMSVEKCKIDNMVVMIHYQYELQKNRRQLRRQKLSQDSVLSMSRSSDLFILTRLSTCTATGPSQITDTISVGILSPTEIYVCTCVVVEDESASIGKFIERYGSDIQKTVCCKMSTENFRKKIKKSKDLFIHNDSEDPLLMEVRRENPMQDYLAFISISQDDLHSPLRLSFTNEDGADLGGLRREFWILFHHKITSSVFVTAPGPGDILLDAMINDKNAQRKTHHQRTLQVQLFVSTMNQQIQDIRYEMVTAYLKQPLWQDMQHVSNQIIYGDDTSEEELEEAEHIIPEQGSSEPDSPSTYM